MNIWYYCIWKSSRLIHTNVFPKTNNMHRPTSHIVRLVFFQVFLLNRPRPYINRPHSYSNQPHTYSTRTTPIPTDHTLILVLTDHTPIITKPTPISPDYPYGNRPHPYNNWLTNNVIFIPSESTHICTNIKSIVPVYNRIYEYLGGLESCSYVQNASTCENSRVRTEADALGVIDSATLA